MPLVTAPAPHQIELQLGHLCDKRCVFCVSGLYSQLRQAGQIPLDPVNAELERARAQGVRKVTFLGGEPTLQRSFLPALERAVQLGFEEIVIFTNGVRTADPRYLESILALRGPITWRFSIQGADHDSHDRTVQKHGALQKILDAMAHLSRLEQRITVNMCVVEQNFRSLPRFPALLAPYNVSQLHLDQMRPSDAGERSDEFLRSIMPRLSESAPYYRQMLQGFPETFDVNVGNLPYCQLPEWAHRIHHGGEPTVTFAAGGGREDTHLAPGWDKYLRQQRDKVKPPQCRECVFDHSCNGVFAKYAQFYGTGELAPVTLERLRSLDQGLRFFVHLVEEHTQALLAARPPAGIRPVRVSRDSLQRVVRFDYQDEQGRPLAFELRPPDAPRPAYARCPDFLIAAGEHPGERLRALLEWVVSALSVRVPLVRAELPRPDPRAALLRILRVAAALRGREVAGWSVTGVTPAPSGDGVSVRFAARGRAVAVVLRVKDGQVAAEVQTRFHEGEYGPLLRALEGMMGGAEQPHP